MEENYTIYNIITGITAKMERDLPKGLMCKNNEIKVPESKEEEFYEWCRRHGMGKWIFPNRKEIRWR